MVLYTIYRIKEESKTIYIGSTNNFKRRSSQHKKRFPNGTIQSIYEYDCDCVFARCLEKYFIDSFSTTSLLNKTPPVNSNDWNKYRKDIYNLITADDIIKIRFNL